MYAALDEMQNTLKILVSTTYSVFKYKGSLEEEEAWISTVPNSSIHPWIIVTDLGVEQNKTYTQILSLSSIHGSLMNYRYSIVNETITFLTTNIYVPSQRVNETITSF